MSRGKENVAREVIYSPTIVDRLASRTGVDQDAIEQVVVALRGLIDATWDAELTLGRPSKLGETR